MARVGFLHLIEISFRAFERKFRRMVERLYNQPFRIVKASALPVMRGDRAQKPTDFWTYYART